ncbi:hypothetical protein VWM68_10805, partial [Campylobacter coli]
GWADYRKSDFLDPIFKHFNTEFKGIYKQDLESYLLENNVKFQKRTDIKNILLIGSGPIVIGQACEFDYSGTQAAKTLKEQGYRV